MGGPFKKRNNQPGGRSGYGGGYGNDSRGRGGNRRQGGGGGFNSHRNNNNSNNNNNNQGRGRGYGGGGGGGGGGNDGTKAVMKSLLSLFFEKNAGAFNPETGTLALANMCEAEDLRESKKSVDFNSKAFAEALAQVISDKFPNQIRCLIVDNNNIRSLAVVLHAFADAGLTSIALIKADDNKITGLDWCAALKRYPNLTEISLLGNPQLESIPNYRERVIKELPNLTCLDRVGIEHVPLRIPNPIPASLTEEAIGCLQFLNNSVFTQMLNPEKEGEDLTAQCYSKSAFFDVSRSQEPFPKNLNFDFVHNCADFEKSLKNAMQTDFGTLRQNREYRNLAREIATRDIHYGARAIARQLRGLTAGIIPRSISVAVDLNSNANVVAIEFGMKVPVQLITVHGTMNFQWNPSKNAVPPASGLPFCSVFFDRTMTLRLEDGAWLIANDMLNLRPNHQVVHSDGTLVAPLFFAQTTAHLERLRRSYFATVPTQLLSWVMATTTSDLDLYERVHYLMSLPVEKQQECLTSESNVHRLLAEVEAAHRQAQSSA